MKILMMTNTYLPHTGGVARSVAWFSEAFRRTGHQVLVVAPTYDRRSEDRNQVVRVPALQNFNGSDFSVRLPVPGLVTATVDRFAPDVIHAHHPFLLGDTALREAAARNVPIVFTHHTMYEQYTHYVPGDSPAMRRFAIRLATEFANLCDHVIAPSESIARVLRQRGVLTPIAAIPTGIDPERFGDGDGAAARRRYHIPPDAFVVGHVGRLAPEKNLPFLADGVSTFLQQHPDAHFLLVGTGSSLPQIERICQRRGVADRLHHPPGHLDGPALADAYHAMDVFAFASHSETQGMVLAEAMTAGVPVVAVDAPGSREVVVDGQNGRLLPHDDVASFAAALQWVASRPCPARQALKDAACQTAEQFSMRRCAARLLEVYQTVIDRGRQEPGHDDNSAWNTLLRRIGEEWHIWAGVTMAVGEALFGSETSE